MTIYCASAMGGVSMLSLYESNKEEEKYLSVQNNTHLIARNKSTRLGAYVYYSDTETNAILNGTGTDNRDISLLGFTVE